MSLARLLKSVEKMNQDELLQLNSYVSTVMARKVPNSIRSSFLPSPSTSLPPFPPSTLSSIVNPISIPDLPPKVFPSLPVSPPASAFTGTVNTPPPAKLGVNTPKLLTPEADIPTVLIPEVHPLPASVTEAAPAVEAPPSTNPLTLNKEKQIKLTPKKEKLLTEDLGQSLEYAICKLIETPFQGKFKYSEEKVEQLVKRLSPLKESLKGFEHTGKVSKEYDFTRNTDHLSVKTTKNKGQWKICPQNIGQTTKKKFLSKFNLPLTSSNQEIKTFIESNLNTLFQAYLDHTFHCPVLFYNEEEDYLAMITIKNTSFTPSLTLGHLLNKKEWNESTSLKDSGQGYKTLGENALQSGQGYKTLGEFQIHNHRNCIKFRFDLKSLLATYPENFEVIPF